MLRVDPCSTFSFYADEARSFEHRLLCMSGIKYKKAYFSATLLAAHTLPIQHPPFEATKGTGKPFIRLSVIHRSPAPGETAMHKVERLALREEGKEACARAEVSETAEMGGETVERVKPPCTWIERGGLKREG